MVILMALVVAMSNVGVQPAQSAVNLSPVGSGFTVTTHDLRYILQQIKIAEYHAQHINDDPTHPCASLVGPGDNQIASPLLSFGLRTVDGSCNNLQPGQEVYGAASQAFPRLTVPEFKPAESNPPLFGPPAPSSYMQTSGNVFDTGPRTASNLIVDQTSSNPAAIAVAEDPSRAQAGPDVVLACRTHPELSPPDCVPDHETLFIPNITTDVGLSPPFNTLFTIFGQFFDHGLDKITNSGAAGTVFVPLKADDPLIPGPDHILADLDPGNTTPGLLCTSANVPAGCDESADNLPANKQFMVLTRGAIVNPPASCTDLTDPKCYRSALNTDTPFVDQSQTYTSNASHQVFMREYDDTSGAPVATGKFLSETGGGLANWAEIKLQAASKLGLKLSDADVHDIPMIATDPYGNFIPGPNGFPQYVLTDNTLVEGDPTAERQHWRVSTGWC